MIEYEFNKIQKEDIVYQKKSGVDDGIIAKSYGCKRCYIHNVLYDAGIYKTKVWTDMEIKFLKNNYPKQDWDFICSELGRHKQSIASKASELGLQRSNVVFQRWSENETRILLENYCKLGPKECQKRFFNDRTIEQVCFKANKLGIVRVNKWSYYEDEYLKESYGKIPIEDIVSHIGRCRNNIVQHANDIGLYFPDRYILSEEQYIRESYLTKSDAEIGEKLGRSSSSIKSKRLSMKLLRPKKQSKVGYESVTKYLRRFNSEWKHKQMIACDYKCAISGERFQDIHHLYSINNMVKQIFQEFELDGSFDINTCDKALRSRIFKRFLVIQNEYGYGVCLSHKIHMQFHTEYGFGNNTLDQFNDFLEKHNYSMHINNTKF